MDQKIYEELTDKYAGKMLDVCYKAEIEDDHISGGTIHELAEVICDCVIESFKRGSAATRFPYEIAERQAKVSVEGIDGETPPDGVANHYYWNMIAGFGDMGEAAECKAYLEEAEPDKVYALFVNGIPVDYE